MMTMTTTKTLKVNVVNDNSIGSNVHNSFNNVVIKFESPEDSKYSKISHKNKALTTSSITTHRLSFINVDNDNSNSDSESISNFYNFNSPSFNNNNNQEIGSSRDTGASSFV